MNKLKLFDLIVFTILSVLCEFLSSFFFQKLHSGFYISFASLLFLILSIRWGAVAIIPFVISGIPLIFTDSIGFGAGVLYYLVANVFAGIPILIYGKRNRNSIIKHPERLLLYVLAVLVCLSLGKGLVILILNQDFTGFYGYFVSMIFTFVINIILMLLFVRSKSQLVYDMNQYIVEGDNDEQ